MKKIFFVTSLLIVASLVLSACGGGGSKASDLLGAIQERGYILVSTDPNYAPVSFLDTTATRPGDTKCPSDAYTTAEMQGFDVDVAKEIGKRLGVETCFATPAWDSITAGSWADRWDISVGSMTIKPARQAVLHFTTPYYYSPAFVAVAKDSGITSVDQLAGKAVCAGIATTYEDWLNGILDLAESSIYTKAPDGITVVSLDTDQECAQAIAAGRTDFLAYVTATTVIDQNLADGLPITKLGKAVFSEELAIALDKSSTLDTASLLAKLDEYVKAMHADGTLAALSTQWFGQDFTQDPSK